MLKTIITLPDGTEISSGAGTVDAIRSVTLTECVNDSAELALGSTCTSALEVTLITPAGGLVLDAGTEVVVHKENDGVRKQIGVFTLEKPARPTANTMKVTGYDRVSKLRKDLTAWLSGLDGWPYTLTAFAGMVCEACGLKFKATEVPNSDFLVHQFSRSSVTGRQLMQWLGEICCRFCRATAEGEIAFDWYTDSGKTITTNGELYYFQNSLTYEDYTTVEIEAVQLRMADSENGALWPAVEDGVNSYIITGNPILNARITEELLPGLKNIEAALAGVRYTPCKVSVPANLDIRAGNTVQITDKNGKTFTAYVMTKTQSGQKDTLECTGSHRRDTPTAENSQKNVSEAQKVLDNMTFEDVVMKLTKEGRIKGMFVKDGELVFNATFIVTGELLADLIKAGIIKSKDGTVQIDLDNSEMSTTGVDEAGKPIKTSLGAGRVVFSEKSGDKDEYERLAEMCSYSGLLEIIAMKGLGIMGRAYTEVGSEDSATELRGDPARVIGGAVQIYALYEALQIGNGEVPLILDGKTTSWKPNGDGTFTLTGT